MRDGSFRWERLGGGERDCTKETAISFRLETLLLKGFLEWVEWKRDRATGREKRNSRSFILCVPPKFYNRPSCGHMISYPRHKRNQILRNKICHNHRTCQYTNFVTTQIIYRSEDQVNILPFILSLRLYMATHELCNHSDHLLYFWVLSPRVQILSFILRVSLRLYMAIHEFSNHTEHLLQFWALSPRVHIIFSFSHSYLSFSMAFFDSPGSGSILALCMIVSKKNPGGTNLQKILLVCLSPLGTGMTTSNFLLRV